MATYHFLSTVKQDIVAALECDTLQCKCFDINKLKGLIQLDYFDSNCFKYAGDTLDVQHSKRTIMAVDNINDIYGVACIHKNGKIRMIMIKGDELEEYIRELGGTLNCKLHNLLDLNQRFGNWYENEEFKAIFGKARFVSMRDKKSKSLGLSYEAWLSIYKEQDTPSNKKGLNEEELNVPKDEPDTTKEELNQQDKRQDVLSEEQILNLPEVKRVLHSLEVREKDLKARESIILEREEYLQKRNISLKEDKESIEKSRYDLKSKELAMDTKNKQDLNLIKAREQQLDEKERNIKEQIDRAQEIIKELTKAIVDSDELNSCNIDEIIISVKDIFAFKEPQIPKRDVNTVFPDFTYELILKSLSTGDIINVPKRYIETLKRQFITMADKSEYDIIYSSIENIMFSENAKEFITAILEYHKKEDTVKVYICKEFSDESLDNSGITYYKANYAKMKKSLRVLYGE